MDDCPREFIDLSQRLADAAGEVVRRYFRQPFTVDTKADASPVTIADRESESAMRELIETAYPNHGIIGEEFGSLREEADYVWVLDPIDGTKSFICGVPLFGTLIGLIRRTNEGREAVLGVIDQAISSERWVGAAGQGATHNGQAISTRDCGGMANAALFTTGTDYFPHHARAKFEAVSAEAGLTRFGTDCYAYGLVASGFIDVVIEYGLNLYDYCALIPVIREAGGVVTDWQGEAHKLDGAAHMVAAGNAAIHKKVISILNS